MRKKKLIAKLHKEFLEASIVLDNSLGATSDVGTEYKAWVRWRKLLNELKELTLDDDIRTTGETETAFGRYDLSVFDYDRSGDPGTVDPPCPDCH